MRMLGNVAVRGPVITSATRFSPSRSHDAFRSVLRPFQGITDHPPTSTQQHFVVIVFCQKNEKTDVWRLSLVPVP